MPQPLTRRLTRADREPSDDTRRIRDEAKTTGMIRALTFILLLLAALPATAQSRFDAVARVGDAVVTRYELDQRTAFLGVVRAQGDLRALALEQLIEDRLKMQAATAQGIGISEEGIQVGMEEFAGRANLTLDEFLRVLRQNGVDRETLRDFVTVGITWREVVRARFVSRAQVSEAEIDQALGTGSRGGLRVLLNEIILPARPINNEQARSAREAERLQRITSISRFQAEAARLSVGPSRNNRGRLDWINLNDLPGALRPIILGLRPGEVTAPLTVPNALILFQLRAIEEVAVPPPPVAAIDYAALYLPGGRTPETLAQAQRIEDRVDTCDDLYGIPQARAAGALDRLSQAPGQIPADIAIELAKLDAGEVSTTLTRNEGSALVFLMLCTRTAELGVGQDREAIRSQLRSRRLEGFADSYLAELRERTPIRIQ
ncbi:MAG: peptidylprolyl isomerase [Shimia sp.]